MGGLLAGGCASSSDADVNAPLPRKSRAEALAWAKRYTSDMARYAEVDIGEDPAPQTYFEECVGEGDEVAEDGRFTLTYATYAHLPARDHIAAVRKLRGALKKRGVDVSDYTENAGRPAVTLYAKGRMERDDRKNRAGGFLLSVDDTVKPAGTLLLAVGTGCLLPPGVAQQQF